jgi:DNA modification methylase
MEILEKTLALNKIEQEFWTGKQRQSNSLHEISYRACFKAELPNYFISKYSKEGELVYDPFSGRGTTGIETALLGRIPIFNDINPLSRIISEPRINLINKEELSQRIEFILKTTPLIKSEIDLTMFFHKETLNEILKVKTYFSQKESLDMVDKWVRMLVLNRLTGHSSGFLSVFTLPPNQAISPERQVKVNEKYGSAFEYRSLLNVCLKKFQSLTSEINLFERENLFNASQNAIFLNKDATKTQELQDESIDLIITSPPFLDVINYKQDNWMRMWFCSINADEVEISHLKNLEDWKSKMEKVLIELKRILKPNRHIAFEVGEVKNGKIKLEEEMLSICQNLNFKEIQILINRQEFSKTANIWGVKNNEKGTNSNRILLIQK